MIWSFIKIALFLVAIVAAAMGASYLSEIGGGILIRAFGYEFTPSPLVAVIGAVLLFAAIWVLIRLIGLIVAFLRFLNGDETAISRYFDRNRERKGFEALAEGLLAVASGEGRLALSKAARAEKFLDRPELTNLLLAQAAETAGERKKAEAAYKRLLTDERTRFVGVRGLLAQKLAEGDTETALKLAEKAYALKPRHAEVQDTLLQLQTQSGNWKGARNVLQGKMRQGLLPKDVHRRRDAVMALQEAKGILDEGATIEAQEAAIAANKSSPDLIPAAVMAAQAYIQKGKARHAARVLLKAWAAQPHPDLAAAFAAIEPEETPEARMKRFRALLKERPEHEETRLLRAELAIAAEDFPEARRALGDLVEVHPTARVLTIMAAIERGEGAEDAVVRGWLARALGAPRGPQWCCDKCHNIQAEWSPACNNCGGFDTLSWREPTQEPMPLPHGTEMLPLIVGRSETDPLEDIEEAEDVMVDSESDPTLEADLIAPEMSEKKPKDI
jgi:HemY protein